MSDADGPSDRDPTLDPGDWTALRRLGHAMIDDLFDDLASLRAGPVWRPVPADVRERFAAGPPLEPQGAEAAYDDFRHHVRPYPRGNNHPRFWGWVNGTGLPLGVLGDLLASGMNPSVSSFENAANLVEAQVLSWLKSMLGFPDASGAVLTSGSSMSNLVGLAVARNTGARCDVRRGGLAASPRRLVLYTSVEAHASIQKAVELLGLGNDSLRRIPVGADDRIDLARLASRVDEDRRGGLQPFCLVGTVGTVNTGAIDDVAGLADLAAREGMWLHLDGAFGALAWLVPELRARLGPMGRADSLAFDLHKWMYLPYDVGCVFVRDAAAHRATFAVDADYLAPLPERREASVTHFPDYGIELSRRFRALKVWLCLKEHGVRGFERQIRHNVRQARHLATRIRSRDGLDLAAPVPLNVVCFRFAPAGLPPEAVDELNLDITAKLQEEGVAFASHTVVRGRVAIRVAITNHRSRREDFDLLVDEVLRHGRNLVATPIAVAGPRGGHDDAPGADPIVEPG